MSSSEIKNNIYKPCKLFDSSYEEFVDGIISFEDKEISNTDLFKLLNQNDNKDIRCWALLKIKNIKNSNEAENIINILFAEDSRSRELASEVIYTHIISDKHCYNVLFDNEKYYNLYVKTFGDINPRVTRNITAGFSKLCNKEYLFDLLIGEFDSDDAPFVKYWTLDGISKIIMFLNKNKIEEHLDKIIEVFNQIIFLHDHLLREKVACILIYIIKYIDFSKYIYFERDLNKLKDDKNFYVREMAKLISV